MGFAEGWVLETFGVRVVEGFFFAGEGCGDGAEAFADAGGSSGHAGEEVLETVDGPPETAAAFFGGVGGAFVGETEIDAQR